VLRLDKVEISPAPYDDPAVTTLLEAMDEELRDRYAGSLGGPFRPLTRALFEPPGGRFLVARCDGEEVACGGVCSYKGETAELRRMYVSRGARRRGIARALLGELEQAAGELGYGRLRLATGLGQPEALALYRSAGYELIPNYGAFAAESGNICLERRL
jgi:GNAT superfamily N-acetyltransferase